MNGDLCDLWTKFSIKGSRIHLLLFPLPQICIYLSHLLYGFRVQYVVLLKFGVIFADMISPGQGIFEHNFTVQELTKLLRITEYKFISWVVVNQKNLFILP